jgi:OmpA-OmpF porin, OOP family
MKSSSTKGWILVAAIAGYGCATPLPSQPPIAVSPVTVSPGEQRVIDNVEVITDASGTMYEAKTFPQAKALSQSFVAALPDRNAPAQNPGAYNVGSIGFGGNARTSTPLAPFDRSRVAGAVSQVEIMGSIDGRGGETPVAQVLAEVGQQLAGKPGRTAVVLFSDGRADDPPGALAVARANALMQPGGICYHTVHVGDDEGGAAFMRDLAEITSCGTTRSASSIANASGMTSFVKSVMVAGAPAAKPAPMPSACETTMRLRGIEFAFDKAEVRPAGAIVLDAAAEQLRACPDVKIYVDGYTDSTGPEDYNMGLSRRRADSVKRYLAGKGVNADRMTTRGFGESDPIASNATREGRARNRRVELKPR